MTFETFSQKSTAYIMLWVALGGLGTWMGISPVGYEASILIIFLFGIIVIWLLHKIEEKPS